MGLPLKNMGLRLKNSVKIKASHPKNSVFFYSTPKEILNFYNLTLENSMFPLGRVRILKCNSPMFVKLQMPHGGA